MKLSYAYTQHLKDPTVSFNELDINTFKQIYKLDADSWLVDRTSTVKFPFNEVLHSKYTIPEIKKYSFVDAAMCRAKELIDANLPVYILWSGGIDSTAIVVAFLKLNQSLENITVILNYDSVKEYTSFFNTHIKPNFKVLVTEEAILKMQYGLLTGVVVSGELADQLVGSPLANYMHQALTSEFLVKEFNFENFKDLCVSKNMDLQSIKCWYDIYVSTMSKAPRPITTMFDFAWWHGFNFRWQAIDLKIFLRIHKSINFETFYSSSHFQGWSVHYIPDLSNIQMLKSEIKNFVKDFTKDSDYYNNKIKHPSSTLYYGVPASAALDENLNKISHKEFQIGNFYNSNNSIKDWLNST